MLRCDNCDIKIDDYDENMISDDFTNYILCDENCWEAYDLEGYNNWLANY